MSNSVLWVLRATESSGEPVNSDQTRPELDCAKPDIDQKRAQRLVQLFSPLNLKTISGFAGAELKSLHRITGLDPAGPLFEGAHVAARLDESDAEFVGN